MKVKKMKESLIELKDVTLRKEGKKPPLPFKLDR